MPPGPRGPVPQVVVDLGFGDAGKGLLTDALVRSHGASVVVRFNGGAQAGHTVVTPDGRSHTFAQLGAGSFVPGVRTHLAQGVVVHPTALVVEAAALQRAGVPDALSRLSIDAACRLTTPFHQAANRLRELARGGARHGSCGVGVGETVADDLAFPAETLRWDDLAAPGRALAIARRVQERKRAELVEVRRVAGAAPEAALEAAVLDDPGIPARWVERAAPLARAICRVAPGAAPPGWGRGSAVFEGAQGVLLDERAGFHPHTTWSACLPDAALAWTRRWGAEEPPHVWGVSRVHAVRHGPGPLPTEHAALGALAEPHNLHGPWQGAVRKGWLDLSLLTYALALARPDAVALTHADALAAALPWAVAEGYDTPALEGDPAPWRAPPDDLACAERRTRWLLAAIPRLVPLWAADAGGRAAELTARVEELGVPVLAQSWGPCAWDVQLLGGGACRARAASAGPARR